MNKLKAEVRGEIVRQLDALRFICKRQCTACPTYHYCGRVRQVLEELHRLTEQVETLQAERDALREDAERYRWLRDGCNAKHSEATHIAKNCWGMEWDLAIDKARIVHEQEGSS